jgi:zinc carboxypeptidase
LTRTRNRARHATPVSLLVFAALVAAVCLPATASATDLLTTKLRAAKAAKRTCSDDLYTQRRGVAIRRVRAADTGLVQARLVRRGRTDWDLAIFDQRDRLVAASSAWATQEFAEGLVHKGDRLTIQGCRRSGRAKRARLSVSTVRVAGAPGPLELVRVSTPTHYSKTKLLETGVDVTEHGRETYLDVVLHGAKDAKTLVKNGFSYKVLVADLIALDRKQARYAPGDGVLDNEAARFPAMPSGRVTYRHLWDFTSDMKMLAEQHPEFVKPITLSETTLEGRPIEGIEIANDVQAQDGRPVFLQMGVHHAREWPSAEMPMEWGFELVQGLVDGDERTTDLLSNARVIVVPVINQDGFNLSRESMLDGQQGLVPEAVIRNLAYKRKNCRVDAEAPFTDIPAEGECAEAEPNQGVDPNRNYGRFWGGGGASGNPLDEIFWGNGPFSEPETQAVQDLISTRQVTTMITNHTYSDLVLRPPGIKSQGLAYDHESYKALGDNMAAQNGYTSQYGWQLYDTTGTTEDWSYGATGGFGFTFEIGKGEGVALTGAGFHPAWPVGVPAEYFGKGQYFGKGNREAYFIALENAANPEMHSVISGKAPRGATLRLSKTFMTQTSPREENGGQPIEFQDHLETTLPVGNSGTFEWHVNPSTRPSVAKGVPGRTVTGPPDQPLEFTHDLTAPFAPGAGTLAQDTATEFVPPEAKPLFADAAPGTYEDREFDIGPNNGRMTFTASWPNHTTGPVTNDNDLKMYRQLEDGSWDQVASAATDNAGGPSETGIVDNPPAGHYRLRVENWASLDRDWTAQITFTQGTSSPGIPPSTESWTLSCIVGGKVKATRQVTIARGQALNVGDACKKGKK